MKKPIKLLLQIAICILPLLSGTTLSAQNFQGYAVYESKISLPKMDEEKFDNPNIDQATADMINEQLKKGFEKTYTLTFDKNASLFKEQEKLEAKNPAFSIEIQTDDEGTYYKNIKEKKEITEVEFFDKAFLITDSLTVIKWKLENETKKIGAYTCYKATAVIQHFEPEIKEGNDKKSNLLESLPEKESKITAWYTPDIPIGHGPSAFWGLPGLMLEVNDGQRVFLCSKVVLNPKEKIEIVVPKKGEKISRKKFNEVQQKKFEEMDEQDGGGGMMIIRP